MEKINLLDGLQNIKNNSDKVITSSGLSDYEYVQYIQNKGFCYEDGVKIGETVLEALTFFMCQKWATESDWYEKDLVAEQNIESNAHKEERD